MLYKAVGFMQFKSCSFLINYLIRIHTLLSWFVGTQYSRDNASLSSIVDCRPTGGLASDKVQCKGLRHLKTNIICAFYLGVSLVVQCINYACILTGRALKIIESKIKCLGFDRVKPNFLVNYVCSTLGKVIKFYQRGILLPSSEFKCEWTK